ncbi:hypothetical protein N7462_011550 [Penicillium macrosclerotiorum]|uniref:uncharacterized protein n=1 Tax=Penicillium macrosclerotiorum TaxID=303699 RepID=UPI0025495509|nr:uncharacterized protein N7462_011550 [Penicillium macrosclerotiorum]KAJ5664737.1 hypothetical protein N7462_011550 [Penicillium macrosclerotiorum]
MGLGVVVEPLVVIVLLFGGTWVNRTTETSSTSSSSYIRRRESSATRADSPALSESGYSSPTSKDGLLSSRSLSPLPGVSDDQWQKRHISLFGLSWTVMSPNTHVFQDRLLSRLLRRLPFLVECWYWALVYWTYQLGRAFTAVTLQESTVKVARRHALQLIRIEEILEIFWEVKIQQFFLRHPLSLKWINWIYSFIHIPGTIAFLVWLYYYTITRNRIEESQHMKPRGIVRGAPSGPLLYQARRRTLAVCNLLAFVVFTLWPCMPPRLLSDPDVDGHDGDVGRSYGFIDTVHGASGARSVWTENRFCNQYAAMPSLHFGYSLMIGLTIMTIPIPSHNQRILHPRFGRGSGWRLICWRRLVCLMLGFFYPFIILVAIVATANHFLLDAIAGAIVCAVGWQFNGVLLNLLAVEDYFLWLVRIHKPEPFAGRVIDKPEDWDSDDSDSRQPVLIA